MKFNKLIKKEKTINLISCKESNFSDYEEK